MREAGANGGVGGGEGGGGGGGGRGGGGLGGGGEGKATLYGQHVACNLYEPFQPY